LNIIYFLTCIQNRDIFRYFLYFSCYLSQPIIPIPKTIIICHFKNR